MAGGVGMKKPAGEDAASLARGKDKVTRRSHNRLPQLLDQAAQVFAKNGYAGASVRDIVRPIGMLPGSLYYHFQTKEELLAAVYRVGVQRISANVDAAIAAADDPWSRLEAACVALAATLDPDDPWSHPDAAALDAISFAGWLRAEHARPAVRRLY